MEHIYANIKNIFLALLFGALFLFLVDIAYGQFPVPDVITFSPSICIYHPQTLLTANPAQRQIIVQISDKGYVEPVDALAYIRTVYRSEDPQVRRHAFPAAVQYSIYKWEMIEQARQINLRAYFPYMIRKDISDRSITSALFRYWFGGTLQIRSQAIYDLSEITNSFVNRDCNLQEVKLR